MTVKDLINELTNYPMDKIVSIQKVTKLNSSREIVSSTDVLVISDGYTDWIIDINKGEN